MSVKAAALHGPYRKSRDEIKLSFYNACVDHERKYRIVELTQQEKDFKRKYSWCIRPNNLHRRKPSSATNIRQEKQQPKTNAKRHGPMSCKNGVVRWKRTSSVKSETGQGQMADDSTSESSCKDLKVTPDDAVNAESRHTPHVPDRQTSETGVELPSLTPSRRKSLLNVESDDRVSYLEDLWNKVFGMEANNSRSVRNNKRKERSLKESYTGIVMQQFEFDSGNVTIQLPDINSRACAQLPKYPGDTTKSLPNGDITPSLDEKDDGSWTDKDVREKNVTVDESDPSRFPKQNILNTNRKEAENESNESVETEQTNTSDSFQGPQSEADSKEKKDGVVEDNTKSKNTPARRRGKSASIHLARPPFQPVWRPRSHSLDLAICSHLWWTANCNVLASGKTGMDRFVKCVHLAVARDKLGDLQGERWRDDLKRCRYLRIPKNCPYMSPIHSDSESGF